MARPFRAFEIISVLTPTSLKCYRELDKDMEADEKVKILCASHNRLFYL